MEAPLNGIKILDFTRAMAGPFCTQLLGDLGAQVIKVESIQGGDETRQWGPFWNDISCYFLSANRNKQSITINLKDKSGLQIIHSLVEKSDVVIENFRPGTMERLGLDYDNLSKFNSRLVYCSISGFGQNGPRSQEPAYDLLMQAYSGLMSLTGFDDNRPVRAGLPVTDLTAGLYATIAILTALYSRQETGLGQRVETSLLEGQVAWLSYYIVGYFANRIIPKPMGSAHHSLAPYGAYQASDGNFVVAVGNDLQWQRLCSALGASDLAEDERFRINVGRLNHRKEMDEALNEIFRNKTVSELVERITRQNVPISPIHSIDQVVQDPQVWFTDMIEHMPHDQIPDLKLPGIPIKFSNTPAKIQSAPPTLGEQTDRIMQNLGFSPENIAEFRQKGVIG